MFRRLPQRAAYAAIGVVGAATLARAFGGPPWLVVVIIAATLVLIALRFTQIPRHIRFTCGALALVALVLAPFARSPMDALIKGAFIAGLLTTLMASVQILARSALRTASIRAVGDFLVAQSARRRYAAFTFAGQGMAAMLNLAGSSVLFTVVGRSGIQGPERIATFCAVTRGFSAAIFWSPTFGNMAILLAIYPSLQWIDVFPAGFAMAQMTALIGIALDRFSSRHAVAVGEVTHPALPAGRLMGSLALALAGFIASVVAFSEVFEVSITVGIIVLGPIAAVILTAMVAPNGERLRSAIVQTRHDASHLPGIANEALLFLTAGIAGTLIANAIPEAWILQLGNWVSGVPIAALALLMVLVVGLSMIGVHPVLAGILVANAFTPSALHLPLIPHFCAVLTGWGLAASATPFSILTLSASRHAGVDPFDLSIRANAAFTALCIGCAAVVLSMFA